MPKLKINGTLIEVEKGTTVLQAAHMLGIEIPHFCYHEKLTAPANCRMCLVELKNAPKPVASCIMEAGEGMEISTTSEKVQKARNGVMEMMLINHPLDCPICDQGGECDLQDQAYGYGFDRSRYQETKRAVKDKDLGPLIKTVMTRCIQCTRCIRFGEEIAGTADLGLLNRGEDVEVGTFVEKAVSSELSGNMIDICPVGALTSKPFAFTARPWELKKTRSIDVHDAVGSNIRIDSRGRDVMRILPRTHDDVNETWISDKTRFSYDGLKRNRLDTPYVRNPKTEKLEKATWEEALGAVSEKMKNVSPNKIVAFTGGLVDVEAVVALKDLMKALDSKNIECRTDGSRIDPSLRAGYLFNAGIAGIEEADSILLIGTNPKMEAALVNARIRKTWLKKKIPIALIGEPVELPYPYHHIGTSPQDLTKLLKEHADKKIESQKPMMIIGDQIFARPDGAALHHALYEMAETFGCVKEGWNGFNVLHRYAGRVGALDVGFTSSAPIETQDMDVIFLLNSDEENIVNNCRKDSFVVYQGHHGDLGAHRADVILPGASYTEKNAMYVNMEGRVQIAQQAVFPVGEAKEDWKILRALSEVLGQTLPYNSLLALRERITQEWPHFAQIDIVAQAQWGEFGTKGTLSKTAFKNTMDNYYMSDVICRASDTMRACVERFLNPKKPKKKAA